MGFFTKTDSGKKGKGTPKAATPSTDPRAQASSNPQQVGIVSGLLRDSRSKGSVVPDGDIVARHFGPSVAKADKTTAPTPPAGGSQNGLSTANDGTQSSSARRLTAVADPAGGAQGEVTEQIPKLEIDPMAHIGRATTITGDIVAEEDLEIQGTVEGTVQLLKNRLTIGEEGHVKARVEAGSVVVIGRVEGDVVASDVVEVHVGGYIGGNVKAPRVILQDGAIVIGGLDMSSGLPSAEANSNRRRDLPPVKAAPSTAKQPAPKQPTLKEVAPLKEDTEFDLSGGSGS